MKNILNGYIVNCIVNFSTLRASWVRNVFRWGTYMLIMWENFGTKCFKCLRQKGPAAGHLKQISLYSYYRVIKKSLCTCFLYCNHQVHRLFDHPVFHYELINYVRDLMNMLHHHKRMLLQLQNFSSTCFTCIGYYTTEPMMLQMWRNIFSYEFFFSIISSLFQLTVQIFSVSTCCADIHKLL